MPNSRLSEKLLSGAVGTELPLLQSTSLPVAVFAFSLILRELAKLIPQGSPFVRVCVLCHPLSVLRFWIHSFFFSPLPLYLLLLFFSISKSTYT